MKSNPYAPSENWNTGESRPGGGVPLWALLVACLSTLAFGCFGGIAGGFLFGFVAGESASESFAEYMSEYEPGVLAVIARPIEGAEGTLILEVLISNIEESPQTVDAIDIYHELARPEEIVRAEPAFIDTELSEDEDYPEVAYTSYVFDPFVVMPGRTVVVRFELDVPDERRTGDVDVWTESGYFRAHVHLTDEAAPTVREPGY